MGAFVYQTIPAKHITSFLQKGHYFTPCHLFPDKMECYYGYCLFNCAMSSEADIHRCVERATHREDLNRWTHSTCVSCWVSVLRDEPKMWNVHGHGGAAIRISVNTNRFCQYIEEQGYGVAYGPVTYEGMTSFVRPQFLSRLGLPEAEDSIHHFFFHKRGCYEWEHEFRVILALAKPVWIPLIEGMIESVLMSPIRRLDPEIEKSVRERFSDRVQNA